MYMYSWDALVKGMMDLTGDKMFDPDTSLAITGDRNVKSYSPTYKVHIDLRDYLYAWQVTGEQRYLTLATKVSRYKWNRSLLNVPITYDASDGWQASLLYYHYGDKTVPQSLRTKLELLRLNFKRNGPYMGQSSGAFFFEGVPLAIEILKRHGYGRKPLASWAACADFGSKVGFCTKKDTGEGVELRAYSSGRGQGLTPGFDMRLVKLSTTYGSDVLTQRAGRMGNVFSLYKDAPKTQVVLTPRTYSSHFVLADRFCPLVVHAPSYWQPALVTDPMPRVFFKLPKGEKQGSVFFEGKARLFGPGGKPFGAGKGVSGWVKLPADKPGLWSFQPLDDKLVRVSNLPPFFAFERAENYFDPEIAWSRETPPAPVKRYSRTDVFVAGASAEPGDKALYMSRGRMLSLNAAHRTADGKERTLIDTEQGTVEFFFRPQWGSFSNPGKRVYHRMLQFHLGGGKTVSLMYVRNPDTPHWFHTHALQLNLPVTGRKGWVGVRTCRRVLLEPNAWVHVAVVWGYTGAGRLPSRRGKGAFNGMIFVNGELGQTFFGGTGRYKELRLPGRIQRLDVEGLMDGVVDELRVSTVMRYTHDFQPPARTNKLAADPNTAMLFHFDGDTKGASALVSDPIQPKLRK